MYVKIINGAVAKFPYNAAELRKEHPQTSFPKEITEDLLAEYNVFSVTQAAKPSYDPVTQNIEKNTAPSFQENTWVIGWTVGDKTPEEQQAYQEEVSESVRATRNKLLSKTDWMALSDVTMSAEMATYRQALRDVTDQEGFPFSVTWPVKPE